MLDFTLVWTGRQFWLSWIEEEGGKIAHCQTVITRTDSRMAFDAPSSALLRGTLLNGATNLANESPLPNLEEGFGWGRLDLRQSLLPSHPVTFHAREDAVGPGCTLEYAFELPKDTQLLRVTLTWDDPPGPDIIHQLSLHVVPPTGAANREYQGNQWDRGVSKPMPPGAPPARENIQQVIVREPPAGLWRVRVRAGMFKPRPEFQFLAQPIALVFVGSGADAPYDDFYNTRRPMV